MTAGGDGTLPLVPEPAAVSSAAFTFALCILKVWWVIFQQPDIAKMLTRIGRPIILTTENLIPCSIQPQSNFGMGGKQSKHSQRASSTTEPPPTPAEADDGGGDYAELTESASAGEAGLTEIATQEAAGAVQADEVADPFAAGSLLDLPLSPQPLPPGTTPPLAPPLLPGGPSAPSSPPPQTTSLARGSSDAASPSRPESLRRQRSMEPETAGSSPYTGAEATGPSPYNMAEAAAIAAVGPIPDLVAAVPGLGLVAAGPVPVPLAPPQYPASSTQSIFGSSCRDREEEEEEEVVEGQEEENAESGFGDNNVTATGAPRDSDYFEVGGGGGFEQRNSSASPAPSRAEMAPPLPPVAAGSGAAAVWKAAGHPPPPQQQAEEAPTPDIAAWHATPGFSTLPPPSNVSGSSCSVCGEALPALSTQSEPSAHRHHHHHHHPLHHHRLHHHHRSDHEDIRGHHHNHHNHRHRPHGLFILEGLLPDDESAVDSGLVEPPTDGGSRGSPSASYPGAARSAAVSQLLAGSCAMAVSTLSQLEALQGEPGAAVAGNAKSAVQSCKARTPLGEDVGCTALDGMAQVAWRVTGDWTLWLASRAPARTLLLTSLS